MSSTTHYPEVIEYLKRLAVERDLQMLDTDEANFVHPNGEFHQNNIAIKSRVGNPTLSRLFTMRQSVDTFQVSTLYSICQALAPDNTPQAFAGLMEIVGLVIHRSRLEATGQPIGDLSATIRAQAVFEHNKLKILQQAVRSVMDIVEAQEQRHLESLGYPDAASGTEQENFNSHAMSKLVGSRR